MKAILPPDLQNSLDNLNYNLIQEIRLRVGKPTVITYSGQNFFFGETGLVNSKQSAYFCDTDDLQNILLNMSNHSLYAVNEQIKQGFVSLANGVRIGIAGQVVSENGKIITIKNFNALNIRFPHEIKGFADNVIEFLFQDNEFLNTLIISPPSEGKTTLLRDLIRLLSSTRFAKKVLVLDERNEISASLNGVGQMNLGYFSDVMVDCTKQFGFYNGIRTMNPDIIATDEIGSQQDCDALEYAGTCGVKIIATIHAKNLSQLKNKSQLDRLFKLKIFQRFVVLKKVNGIPTVASIYDENFVSLLNREGIDD